MGEYVLLCLTNPLLIIPTGLAHPWLSYEHHMAYCPTTMPYGSGWDTQKASERPTWYPASRLHTAWGLLINASRTDCANTTATAFDIADVGREYISIAACNIAYDALRDAHTTAEIIKANATMGMVMADLDRLLAASGGFLLGQWISDARALAINAGHPEDANFLEWNGVCSISFFASLYPTSNFSYRSSLNRAHFNDIAVPHP